ncbi:glycosyltransferase [Candidatus Saccharibacteria bacterium]|nr:glycosyltransferase [Candidatus Saccharibacteria bacterium]
MARVTYSYCDVLTKMGHAAYFIAPNDPDAPDYPFLNTVLSPSIKIPTEQWHVGLPGFGFKFRKNLKEIPFDIVHAQSPFVAGHEALRIAKKRNIPLVSTFHSKYYDDFLQHTHSKKISQLLTKNVIEFYNKCDAVWAVNDGTADVLRQYGFGGKITVMENGTDAETAPPEVLEEMKQRIRYDEATPLLIFVGQHNVKKNIDSVIEACKIMVDRGARFRLVTAGNGPDFDKMVRLSHKLGLDEVAQFLGYIDNRSEIMALYSLANLLVFPSLYDNAPMVLREAAAMRTPALLVAGSTAAENLTDGENALIARDESPEAIAERILDGFNSLDTIGEKAQKTIPISWSVIMKKVASEYEELIREKQGRISERA